MPMPKYHLLNEKNVCRHLMYLTVSKTQFNTKRRNYWHAYRTESNERVNYKILIVMLHTDIIHYIKYDEEIEIQFTYLKMQEHNPISPMKMLFQCLETSYKC